MENYAENFGQYYAEESDDFMQKRRQIMQKFLINKSCSLGFLKCTKYTLMSFQEFNSFMTCLTFCCHLWIGISSFNTVFP